MEQLILETCAAAGVTTDALSRGSKAGALPIIRAGLARQLVYELGIS